MFARANVAFFSKIYLSPRLHEVNLKPKLGRPLNYLVTALW